MVRTRQRTTTFLLCVAISIASLARSNRVAGDKPERPVAIQSFNYPKTNIRHRDGFSFITEINSELAGKDSSWYVCPGLAGSANHPNQYLRHQEGRVKLDDFEDTDLFKNDASFHHLRQRASLLGL